MFENRTSLTGLEMVSLKNKQRNNENIKIKKLMNKFKWFKKITIRNIDKRLWIALMSFTKAFKLYAPPYTILI